MTPIIEFAPAKLNLYLHVTGRRADGYHDLDSLVAFATIGDEIHLSPEESFSFEIVGTQAKLLSHESPEDNLVVKAARSLAELTGLKLTGHLTLVKNLPVASGIGGGSSDAAAALRALSKLWHLDAEDPRITKAARLHGQDVPVCMRVENTYMTATGVMPAPKLPRCDVILVNPNKGLSTPLVYKTYRDSGDGFSLLSRLDRIPRNLHELIEDLDLRTNDLYRSAGLLMPEILEIIEALRASGSLCARMSGSGATCFGLYPDAHSAQAAALHLRHRHPDWWVEVGVINA